MKPQNTEEQHEILKGWEDTDQNPMYVKICIKKPQPNSNTLPSRQSDLTKHKPPYKDHRRSPSKPHLRIFDQNILKADKHILQKYATKESERGVNSSYHQQSPLIQQSLDQQNYGKPEPHADKNNIQGIGFELRENEELKEEQNYLFSGGKSQKKYRRRFYAKTKILDPAIPKTLEQNKHRPRIASKFCSSQLDFDHTKSYFATQQLFSKKQNNSIGQITTYKKKTFPVFFRELEGQQKDQQKQLYKKILEQKMRERKHRSHFMISSGNPFSHSVEFGDSNIFPRRFL